MGTRCAPCKVDLFCVRCDTQYVCAQVTEVFSEAPPALVVLSACTSAGIAESLRHVGVKFVIALDRDVLDDDAPKFAALFYVNLFKGETVGKAYRMARAGMEMTDATDRGFRLLGSEADDVRQLPACCGLGLQVHTRADGYFCSRHQRPRELRSDSGLASAHTSIASVRLQGQVQGDISVRQQG